MDAYRKIHNQSQVEDNINDYLHAGWRVRDAAALGRSIDNVLNQNNQDQKIPVVGKLAIAREILRAERDSKLFIGSDVYPSNVNWNVLRDTWLLPFSQMLTTDVQHQEVENIFDNISIITFNYDRSFEFFVPFALIQAYGLDRQNADRISSKLTVIHPYGSLGSLYHDEESVDHVVFGSSEASIIPISARLMTFAEQQQDAKLGERIRSLVRDATRLVFLGFGFHTQNLELLKPEEHVAADIVIGTVYKEPGPARDIAEKAIRSWAPETIFPEISSLDITLLNQTCAQLLSNNYSVLTSPKQ